MPFMRRLFHSLSIAVTLPLLAAGHEFTSPTLGTAISFRGAAGPVSNGSSFLTLWSDDTFRAGWHVHASLADADGIVIGSVPLLAYAYQASYSVVPVGSEYVVFVSGADLEVLPTPFPIRVVRIDHPAAVLAGNGRTFLAQRLYDNVGAGELLDREGHVIKSGIPMAGHAVSATVSHDDYVVAVTSGDRLQIERINAAGDVVGGAPTVVERAPGNQAVIAVASLRDRILIVWSARDNASSVLRYGFVTPEGIAARGTLSTAGEPDVYNLQVAAAGESFVVTATVTKLGEQFDRYRGIAMRIDADGNVVDSPPATIMRGSFLAGTSANQRVVFTTNQVNSPLGSYLVALVYRSDAPASARTQVLTQMLRRQVGPALATDGVDFFAAWSDQSGDSQAVSTARMARTGDALDGPGVDLMRVPGYIGAYDVAFGGGIYLAVWNYYGGSVARRIARDGTWLDSQPIAVHGGPPVVRWNGSAFVIFWMNGTTLMSSTVSPFGEPSDERAVGPLVPPSTEPGVIPSLASFTVTRAGDEFLVVGQIDQNAVRVGPCACPGTPYVIALRSTLDGRAIGPVTVLTPGSGARVAASNFDAIITFQRGNEVWAARTATNDGNVPRLEAPVRLFKWFAPLTSAVSWTGHDYAVAIRARVNNRKTYLTVMSIDSSANVHAMRAADAGPYDFESLPAIITNAAGDTLVAISEVPTPAQNPRLRGYFVDEMRPARPAPQIQLRADAVAVANQTTVSWNPFSAAMADLLLQNGTLEPVIVAGDLGAYTFTPSPPWAVSLIAFNESGFMPAVLVAPHAPPLRGRAVRH
jgi:hypothetical protein